MRYIGSKTLLLENIEKIIKKHTTGNETTFCDLFTGTGVVARYFKPFYEIYTNDILNFSYAIQKATIENNQIPQFQKLKLHGILDPFQYLENTAVNGMGIPEKDFFIANHYAPSGHCERMYFTAKNARRIDFIRITIESWKQQGWIDEREYYYLLAGLIEGVPYVSNITGTYGAYLKKWDSRALKPFEMVRLEVLDNQRQNQCFQMDANQLIRMIDGEILYLDPPYNTRQYAPNYHMLETISLYDSPVVCGITGVRPYQDMKSAFSIRSQVKDAFEDLIAHAKFEHMILSYNTDGLLAAEEIANMMRKYGIEQSFRLYSVPYRKYKAKSDKNEKYLYEHIFVVQKDLKKPKVYDPHITHPPHIKTARMSNHRKKFIKSPFNYVGGKYRLLPQIAPLFPKDIHTFVDLFAGGCNVGINANAELIIFNDINSKIIEVFQCFRETPLEQILDRIYDTIEKYGLSKTNEEGYIKFREYYNKTKNPIDLYTLACYSFNYQIRFNNRLEYNNPFGKNRSQFADSMKTNLIAFVQRIQEMKVEFMSRDFAKVPLDRFGCEDFIYCDPPYLISTGTYNDGKRGFKDWRKEEELRLYEYLDHAHARGIRFALTNVLEHKGKINEDLYEWSKKYRVIDLNGDYSNASYNTKRHGSREVLVVNYEEEEENI